VSDLYQVHATPALDAPVLVVAMDGWVDAGLGAASAIAAISEHPPSEELVSFDGDHFLDLRARRPIVHIVDGVMTALRWPRPQIRHGHDQAGADVLFLVGPEPDYHWRAFVDAVVRLVRGYTVRLVVGLGAFPAPAPHTRPVRLAATAPPGSSELIGKIGSVQGELEVPAGVLSALEMALGEAAVPVVSLWARVPHYVSAMPFPMASAALIDGLAAISGLVLDSGTLQAAGDRARTQVDELIASNPDHVSMVAKLEEVIDASEGNPLGLDEVPSADELAAELERFLRGEEHG